MDFTGKVVLITGASGGVGAPTAKLFASLNATLALVGRNEERLKAVVDSCLACNGIQPLKIKLDLTHDGNCEDVIQRTLQAFGRLDVLVNCAGRIALNSMFDENIDSFDELFKINLRVPYKLTHCALPYLVQTKGNVVNLKAAHFDTDRPGFLNFAVVNSAMETFTKAAALDVINTGVRINAISVNFDETDSFEEFTFDTDTIDEEGSECDVFFENVPEIKVLEPRKVARTIVTVASGRYPGLNGASIYNL